MIYQHFNKLEEYIESGLISKRKHPTDDLWIYNYTQKCQYDGLWDDITLDCRGLILDIDGNIIARPFKKFFNMEEVRNAKYPFNNINRNYTVYSKMDGSLGISYVDSRGNACIATRGSFDSTQALWATEEMQKHSEWCDTIKENSNVTYMFEIFGRQNRIILDYEQSGLIHLHMHTKDGKKLNILERMIPLTVPYTGILNVRILSTGFDNVNSKVFDRLKAQNTPNEEGYVVRFEDGDMFKIKFENYIIKHKLYTGCSPRTIWENMSVGQSREDIVSILPDEMYDWASHIFDNIQDKFDTIECESYTVFDQYSGDGSRKGFAEYAKSKEDITGLLFGILDDRDISDSIWKMIKPNSTQSYFESEK